MLAGELDLEIVGEAATGREAVDLCCALNPDLVLMDVRMPELDGLEATGTIMQHCPTRILIVTISAVPDLIPKGRQGGALGCLFKDVSHQEFLTAIRRVLQGEKLF
jgi:DNA-binding NarL/FixJ family response regulator